MGGLSSIVVCHKNQKGTRTAEFMEFGKNGRIIRVVAKLQRLTGGIPTCVDAAKLILSCQPGTLAARRRLGYSEGTCGIARARILPLFFPAPVTYELPNPA